MTKRLNIILPDKEAAELAEMTKSTGLTATALIRQAILHEAFLRKERKAGARLFLEDSDGNKRQIVIL